MAELLKAHEERIRSIRLIPSDGGRFEVTVDGDLVFSKLKAGRHVQEGEILRLVAKRAKA
jgi:selenoprotein W-related protein